LVTFGTVDRLRRHRRGHPPASTTASPVQTNGRPGSEATALGPLDRVGAGLWGDHSDRGGRPANVMILSASMGAGHDGAAHEMAARLRAAGHQAEVRDFLDAGPLRIGRLLRRGYEIELKHIPSAYDATYRLWYRVPWLCPLISWLVCLLTHRRVLRWVRRGDIGIVVSTYPLATLCLGRLRALGRLRIPAINFITDFGVHPLWVHRGIDLNLAVHQGPADDARRQTGRPSIACGPLVAASYEPGVAATAKIRAEARAELGLAPDARAVLIVAGSWGVGRVAETFRLVGSDAAYVPIVVCGRDETLRARLQREADALPGPSVVLGWTDRMPRLMAACDALIENAGGLTSLEALRIGLPVVSYDPIAGHGRENTAAMARAGVSLLAADEPGLLLALDSATRPGWQRHIQVGAGRAMFVADGAELVARTGRPAAVARLAAPRRARVVWATSSRTAAGLFAFAAIAWGGMTTGVGIAAASTGAGVARPPAVTRTVYAGVRLDALELLDPTVIRAVRQLGITVVVDDMTAEVSPAAVQGLAAEGVDVENGGHGFRYNRSGHPVRPELWTRARLDAGAGQALSRTLDRPVPLLVPGRRINAFDLLATDGAKEKLVLANVEVQAGSHHDIDIANRSIVLINGLNATPASLIASLAQFRSALTAAHLTAVPLVGLR
jgi:processive 1,2-diacylglycerol beta-glucosyltransferase